MLRKVKERQKKKDNQQQKVFIVAMEPPEGPC